MACQPLKSQSDVEQLLDLGILVDEFAQFGLLLEGLIEGNVKHARDEFGDFIHLAIRDAHGAPDITQHPFSRHGAEGNDLGDVGGAVLAPHILDDFLAAVNAEIDIDIRHRNTFRV